MFSFSDMSFKGKITVLIGMAMGGMALLVVLAVSTINAVKIGNDLYADMMVNNEVATDIAPPSLSLSDMRRTVLQIESAATTHEPARVQKMFDQAAKLEAGYNTRLDYYKKNLQNEELKKLVMGKHDEVARQYFSIFNQQYGPAIKRGDLAAAAEVRQKQLRPLLDEEDKQIAEILKNVDAELKHEEDAAKAKVASRLQWMIWMSLLIAGAVAWVGWAIATRITKPVGQLVATLEAVAKGDLTATMETTSKDEIGQLSRALDVTVTSMRDAINQMNVQAQTIASASAELASSADEIAKTAESQKDHAMQVAAAMTEMAATVEQVSDNSNLANDTARGSGELAKKGGQVVSDAVTVIEGLATSTKDLSGKMEQLGRSSDEIGKIVSVIEDIADQTNLLALNAAIEAARAGDQGRGFAVVADEVRKLAERTTSATKEISTMIATIQQETRKAVEAMQSGSARVEAGVSAATRAGDSLEEIIQSSQRLQEMVMIIATAATEQSATTSEINHNIDEISQSVQQSSVAAAESAKACSDLSVVAAEMERIVGQFETGQRRSAKSEPWREAPQMTPLMDNNGYGTWS